MRRVLICPILILLTGCAPAGTAPPDEGTRIVLLGTGTPNADPQRSGPATAILVGDSAYLVDAGPGVVRRAEAAHQRGEEGLRVSNLRFVFFTHLHSDHTLGYPDLVFSPWVLERDVPLQAFGPPGLQAMTDHILAAWREDIDTRLNGLEPANPVGYRVEVHEVGPGPVYSDSLVTIEAFRVPHGSIKDAYGYRFQTPDGTIVLSGDTGPFEGLAEIARGADVLIHEVYATAGWEHRDPVWQRYHSAFHTSGRRVGEIAQEAGVSTVVLTHLLLWGTSAEELVREVRGPFSGRVICGEDLDRFLLRTLTER